jgi:hypothetical protein
METPESRAMLILCLLKKISEDERVNAWHIALYWAMLEVWLDSGINAMVKITRQQLMKQAHISSLVTYHKYLRELVALRYVDYQPSYNRYAHSKIIFLTLLE